MADCLIQSLYFLLNAALVVIITMLLFLKEAIPCAYCFEMLITYLLKSKKSNTTHRTYWEKTPTKRSLSRSIFFAQSRPSLPLEEHALYQL